MSKQTIWQGRRVRPSTILLTTLTVVFAAATIVLAVLVGPGNPDGLVQVLRLGGIVTIGFGAGLAISVVNHRRRDRLQRETEANPGAVFVEAHATDSTLAELEAWSPGLGPRFPCDLGFDRNGLRTWSRRGEREGVLIATRPEITGFEVFDEQIPLGSTLRWGIAVRLAPRAAGPGFVRLWMIDGQPNHDEYAMRRTIPRIESALGT
ncbi:hypothetical protein [Curtobacterium sp. ISL-83]|uniref:hypothetical protein n=1 Tax=Curtobacterium sp. ISL-83 TaxID=2819145 RepID=UPI001BE63440|nr:hypothetical protein [Curtobacterium sp. ISL-83]MBT2503776.1 hypothetical protein [Curtobacterium sp. ISL-83]